MIEHDGISVKFVGILIEEFSAIDALYAPAREALPIITQSEVYDSIANNICDEALFNAKERMPNSLSSLVEEIDSRGTEELSRFVRELYNVWVDNGKPACGDDTEIRFFYFD